MSDRCLQRTAAVERRRMDESDAADYITPPDALCEPKADPQGVFACASVKLAVDLIPFCASGGWLHGLLSWPVYSADTEWCPCEYACN